MSFLSIDCSAEIGSLFIKAQNKTFSKILQSDKSNIDLLMLQILDFFKDNNIKIDNINEIFVNQGPGSFSGLRGSLSTAKGISLSKKLNLYGYNTFIWSGAPYINKKKNILSFIKFRDKYFCKKFDSNLNSISQVKEITESEIIKKNEDEIKVAPKNMVKIFSKKILTANEINIVNLDHNLLEMLKLKGLLDKNSIKPLYLR